MSKNTKNLIIGILIGVFAFAIAVTGAVFVYSRFFVSSSNEEVMTDEKTDKKDKSSKDRKDIDNVDHLSNTARHLERKMITVDYDCDAIKYNPSVAAYKPKADLSDVYDIERVYLGDEAREKLARNNFVVAYGSEAEFFDLYEFNRYAQYASFVTTDSMMHTYHLYFAMLQENTERNYLYGNIERLSKRMYDNCLAQYEELKGSEWEEASRLNTAYFAIACTLLETDIDIPEEVKETVEEEIKKINASDTVAVSEITGAMEDYSQYKPRGYYDGDELLERYFKAMMLFGHLNFAQKDETNNRCALLMTLAMDEEAYKEWDAVYEVTSFFVGASDDNGYYEYLPLIDEAYGQGITASDLIGDKKGWDRFDELTASLEAPAINSEIFADDEGKTDKNEESKGYRFMGQRFTLDAAILDKLIYGKVKQADDGSTGCNGQ